MFLLNIALLGVGHWNLRVEVRANHVLGALPLRAKLRMDLTRSIGYLTPGPETRHSIGPHARVQLRLK